MPQPIVDLNDDAVVGIISLGSNDGAVQEARSRLAANGVATSYLRLRALPIGPSVRDFIHSHDKIVVVKPTSTARVPTS